MTISTTLTFVEHYEYDTFSTYRTQTGATVYLEDGTARRLIAAENLDLRAEWLAWAQRWAFDFDSFTDYLKDKVIDPDTVEEYVAFCSDCSDPEWTDDLSSTAAGGNVCDSCRDEYTRCSSCEDLFDETTTTLTEVEVCDRCRANYWTYCEHCDGYRADDDPGHDHRSGCDCAAPGEAQSFVIRNNGDGALANDTIGVVTLPAGIITPEGIGAIAKYLRDQSLNIEDSSKRQDMWTLSYSLGSEELGDQWQTKRGNFSKRLQRFAYNTWKMKLSPEIVSEVGNIARVHSTAVDHRVTVTRDLNQDPGDFCHSGSCWWSEYEESRCALKSNGGFGLRSFDEYDNPIGRAWVMPLRLTEDGRLVPTFDALTPDAFVVFNGYGTFDEYAPARIMAHMAGMTYRKINFTCEPMYVNSEAGYLIAGEELASGYTDGELDLSVREHSSLFNDERVMANA